MSWVRAPPSTLKSVSLFIRLTLFLFGEKTMLYLNILSDMEGKRLAETIRCFLDDGSLIAVFVVLWAAIAGGL